MERCFRCETVLSHNEIGAYKKFINRSSTEFMCLDCLARELNVPKSLLVEKIEHFKHQGCTLFV